MRRHILASSIALLVAGVASAQTATYNPAAETTLSGTIRYVISAAAADGTVGVHLEVTTAGGPVRVALGPAMFIGMNNFYFYADEKVQVVGAKVGRTGEIWARTITKDGASILTLRDDDGTPRWPRATPDDPDGCGVAHAPIR
jgi:hypothetical protein